jgi:acyl-CoA dehydrogenase
MVKLHASEMLGRLADKAVQIFGGMGYCADMPIDSSTAMRASTGSSTAHPRFTASSLPAAS